MYTRLAYLLGFSALFPSVALFHVGSTTGIQFFLFFLLVVFFLDFSRRRTTLQFWPFILSMILVTIFLWHLSDNYKNDLIIKNFISFSLCLLCVLIGIKWTSEGLFEALLCYINGYNLAAIFSSLFAMFQFFIWNVIGASPGVAAGFRNNQGFGDLSQLELLDLAGYGRAFGFSSEPSVLALLLMPALMVLLAQKKWLLSVVVFFGIFATQSLTSFLFLMLLIIYLLRLQNKSKFTLRNIIFAMSFIFLSAGIFLNSGSMQLRVGDLGTDGSTLSRLNSLFSGWDAVLERPWFGWGIQSDELNEFVILRSTIFEENPNIHSLALSFAAWFGIPAFVFFMMPCVRFFVGIHKRVPHVVSVFLAASIWPAFLTLNYFNIYSVWLAFGAAAGYALRYWICCRFYFIRATKVPHQQLQSTKIGALNMDNIKHVVKKS